MKYAFLGTFFVSGLLVIPCSARAELTHRYSFDDGTANDSVGKVNGKLMGDAKAADGALKLQNDMKTSGDAKLSYVSFAERILPKTGSATIEVWFTSNSKGPYARLFDFGQRGQGYLFLTVDEGGDVARAAITDNDWGEEATLRSAGPVNDNKPHMLAVVIDGTKKTIHLFVDGKEQGQGEPLGETSLEKVKGVTHSLGRSIFETDVGYSGTIDEFRVFDTALKPEEIAAHNTAGAKAIPGADAKKPDAEKK
jgi:large repetitive protein